MSFVAGPFAVLMLIPGLAVTALGVGAGRGWPFVPLWGVPWVLTVPFGFYLVSIGWGIVLGAMIGLIRAAIRRARRGPPAGSWWTAANRPIRLFGRRSDDAPPDASAPSRRLRRLRRWMIGVPSTIAVLTTVSAFGAGVYLGRIVDRRLADAIASADRDDPSWRIDDLMAHREPVPDEENSAIIVAEALETVPDGWPVGPVPPPGTIKPPPGPAAVAIERLAATPDNVRMDDATAVTIRDELETYREPILIARTVAEYRQGRHELEIGRTVFDTLLPETQASRNAARLLAADAAIRAHDGDLDGALDSCRVIVGVGRSIGDEPCLISVLVRDAIGTVATNTVRRVLAQGEASDAALARLQALLLDELARPFLVVGMKGERAMLDEMIRRLRDGEIPISSLSSAHRRGASPPGSRPVDRPLGPAPVRQPAGGRPGVDERRRGHRSPPHPRTRRALGGVGGQHPAGA